MARGATIASLGLLCGLVGGACREATSEQQSSLGSACPYIAGTWQVTSTCGLTSCTFYEDHCVIHYDCSGSTLVSGDGSVSGSTLTWGGGVCTASIAGTTMSGSCSAGSPCNYTMTHR
jgi:hypothetical protein